MDTKRKATTDLNHDNWDREDEPEEKGTFQVASDDEIKQRVIKKARRKITDVEAGQAKSVFSGFSGFAKSPSIATTASNISSPFSFLSKMTPTTSSTLAKNESNKAEIEPKADDKKFAFEKSNTYYAKLKGLNQAVSAWIKTHVDKSPLCILTPIFSDYEKYLKEIQEEKPEGTAAVSEFKFGSSSTAINNTPTADKQITKPANAATTPFSFGINSFISGDKTKSPLDSAGAKPAEPSSSNSSIATKTSSESMFTAIPKGGFSFSAAKPFTFGSNVTKPVIEETNKKDDGEDEDEPPKVEFKQVVEEDSVYSKKCKLFVKQDGNYAERGVGMIYLKPIKGQNDKTQLIVRADTNLGNILLNIILNESIPAQRLGKNNVMMVCIPTPESDPKPTSVLLRVKTGDEADELLAAIDKYKK